MVYVKANGELGEKPFSIIELFWNFYYFIVFFFQSLLSPLLGGSVQYDPDLQARFRSNLRNGNSGGYNGGNGGGLWPSRPSNGNRRLIGRLNTQGQSSMPTCMSGGCCGG